MSDSLAVIDDGTVEATVVDLATGGSRPVRFSGRAGGDAPYGLIATGGYFVYLGEGGTLAVPTSRSRPPRRLGPSTYDLPSQTPGRVWLITTTANREAVPATAQEVRVDGHDRSPSYRLPGGQVAIGSIKGGLVFAFEVWYPPTNATGLGLAESAFVDAHGSLLAGASGCSPLGGCASVEVINVATGKQRRYPAPAGTAGWVPTAGEASHNAFAPDGRHLAVRVALSPGGPNRAPPSRVYVLDLTTGSARPLPHSEASAYSRVAWTPDSRWLLFENDNHTLGAYQPADAASRTFRQPCCGVALLAIRK